ncbi:MAG: hypothetical protein M3Q12_08815 [Pseudomonadota bacterium]|uniref:hypothetical protein n=1 Tax=Polaromonas sp. TaxID=1869339 RepID=UPI0017F3DC97|nr:hypothetical protein [Polaromonas sp.]MBA3593808.1 hypothetical protein [Polaromonas sp.]MDQ3272252.1 hypothetical protein [Pseudomonadota bacterium]
MPRIRRYALALFMLAAVACAWWAPLDRPAAAQVDAGLKRALISFASARALNAVISVAQGTELSMQPLGVGVTLTPGQLLDPVNDLIEKFSTLMLAASVAFGVQKALIAMGAYWLVSLALTVVALGWAWLYVRQRDVPVWLSRALVIVLMLRFAIPVVTLGTDLLWQKFLAPDYQASQQGIASTSVQAAKLAPPPVAQSPGMLDRMKGWLSENADVKARFEELKQAAEQAIEHIIRLIVVFVLQTVVIPMLLLWALYALARGVFERAGRWPDPTPRSP